MNLQNEDAGDAEDELDQHGLALHQLIQDYMDEHDLSDEIGALLLLNISVRMRMVGYALETEQPTAAGLRTDLDRFQREIGECIAAAKKGAEEFVEEAMVLREAAEDEEGDIEEEQKGKKGIRS